MKVWLPVLAVAACCLHIGYTLTCLHCDNIFQPRHCRTVSKCKDNEMCGAELVSSHHGDNLYNIGCFPKTTCEFNYSSQSTCLQCCNSDLCNVNLCNQPDYPSPRGPVCFSCRTYDNNSLCRDIDFCAKDEVCRVTGKLEFGDRIFTSSCTSSRGYQFTLQECKSGSPLGAIVVGKRSIHKDSRSHEQGVCDICCESDVCNQDCDSAYSERNHCLSNPCVHGKCESRPGSFVCNCYLGYTGSLCDLDIDECVTNPCVSGTCVNLDSGFLCQCEMGFGGPLCETNIDECASSPCNNGTCVDGINGFTCFCDPGFSGQTCEMKTGACSSNPCVHGTCIDEVNSFRCDCKRGYNGTLCDTLPRDCLELQTFGFNTSGVYNISIQAISETIEVYCDMTTDGGGWTVIQYRFNGSVDFYRNFSDYDYGFGDMNGEFWIGLRYIYELSKQTTTELRIDLVSSSGKKGYEKFDNFYLSSSPQYTLHLSHGSGSAGDSSGMYYSVNYAFTTLDVDRDKSSRNCAEKDHGGWWYGNCAHANLNGKYYTPGSDHGEEGMIYRSFDSERSLKSTKMMIRRK